MPTVGAKHLRVRRATLRSQRSGVQSVIDVQALAETGLVELAREAGRKVIPSVAEELRLEVVL
ncbi:MAG: hypothetical protein HYZ50_24005 [Deltaproteobacteria bacterium]|nr:hypothetical protein [Deltaproteobacteria bacterium]